MSEKHLKLFKSVQNSSYQVDDVENIWNMFPIKYCWIPNLIQILFISLSLLSPGSLRWRLAAPRAVPSSQVVQHSSSKIKKKVKSQGQATVASPLLHAAVISSHIHRIAQVCPILRPQACKWIDFFFNRVPRLCRIASKIRAGWNGLAPLATCSDMSCKCATRR